MKTVTKTYNVYSFEELPEEIRQQLVNSAIFSESEYSFRYDEIYRGIEEAFKRLLPESDLIINLDVSCCQGSGLTFSGSLSCFDLLDRLAGKFTEKEYKTIRFYCSCVPAVKIEDNNFYSYYHLNDLTIYNEWQYALMLEWLRDINDDLLLKFSKLANEYLLNYCWKQYDTANNYINLLTDAAIDTAKSDAIIWLSDNDYLADGSIFLGA